MRPEFELLPDEELARQSQAGSPAAFEELVSRYEARIFAFTRMACRNQDDARDLTQETFVRAFLAIGQYRSKHPFRAWLFTIARRKCIDHFRSRPFETEASTEVSLDPNDPAEQLARREDSQNLWARARDILPGKQFEALWLRYGEEMNVGEIGAVLGLTRTHVKVLLFRARQALIRHLGEPLGTGSHSSNGLRVSEPRMEIPRLPLAVQKGRI
jgi:RNA polymerase sigma-70 factor, ECF subfamily